MVQIALSQYLLCIALAALFACGSALAEQHEVFFAASLSDELGSASVYKVETDSWQIVASRALGEPHVDGQLSPDGRLLYVLPFRHIGGNTVMVLNARDLSLISAYTIDGKASVVGRSGTVIALSRVFIHPETELVYLAGDVAASPGKVYVLDPSALEIVETLDGPWGKFTFDRSRNRLYVGPGSASQNPVWKVDLVDLRVTRPEGLVFLSDFLAIPETDCFVVIRWIPRESGSDHQIAIFDGVEDAIVRDYETLGLPVLRGAAVSSDSRRLFAAVRLNHNQHRIAVIDLDELAVADLLPQPELISHFTPAPDGDGLWMVATGGAVYRIDETSGAVLETIPLPFPVQNIMAINPAGN